MVKDTIAYGATPILQTLNPLGSAASTYTSARGMMVLKHNSFLRELAYYQYPQCLLYDGWQATVEPTSLTGQFKTSYVATDGVHPTPLGKYAMASALSQLTSRLAVPAQMWVGSVYDRWDEDNSIKQIDPNPLNTGSGGTKSTSGAGSGTNTGTVPDSMTVTWTRASTGANVCSVVSRTDGIGNDILCSAVSVDSGDQLDIIQTTSMHTRVSAGDQLVAECNLQGTSLSNVSNVAFSFDFTYSNAFGSHTITTTPAAITTSITGAGQLSENFNLYLRTLPFTVPPSGLTNLRTRVRVGFSGAGGANIRYGRHSLHKLVSPPSTEG